MSTLESAICFTLVLLVLCALILFPIDLCVRSLTDSNDAIEDVLDTSDSFVSQERLNTFLTGISENYRIIYGSVVDEVTNEE